MLSSDAKTQEIVSLLLQGKFSVKSEAATLTQEEDTDPFIINGAAEVHQDDSGLIILDFKSKDEGWSPKLLSWINSSLITGDLIPPNRYITAKLKAPHDCEWTAPRLHFDKLQLSLNAASNQRVRTLSMVETNAIPLQPRAKVILLGKYRIATNDNIVETHLGKTIAIDLCRFSYNSSTITIKLFPNYTEITIDGASGHIEFVYKLLQAISIYVGISLRPLLIEIQNGNQIQRTIFSFDHKKKVIRLPTPLQPSGPRAYDDFVEFITRYLQYFESRRSSYFGYWHKVHTSHQSSMETMALSLGVAIEGVVKSDYSNYGLPKPELLSDALKAKKIIEDDTLIPTTIKGRLHGTISSVSRASIRIAIRELSDKLGAGIRYDHDWTVLRNSTAHADELDDEFETRQRHITQIFRCLTFFYRLLFLKIGYCGHFTEYPGQQFKYSYTTATE